MLCFHERQNGTLMQLLHVWPLAAVRSERSALTLEAETLAAHESPVCDKRKRLEVKVFVIYQSKWFRALDTLN